MIIDGYLGTVHIRTERHEQVAEVFKAHATGVERAYVAPAVRGWSALYLRAAETARRWAELVSRELKTVAVAFHVIEDEEVFAYQVFQCGKLLDEYASKPAYFLGDDLDAASPERIANLRGRPEVWEPFLINGRECKDIAKLLASSFDDPRSTGAASDYLIPATILDDLCSMIGIVGANISYEDLEDEIGEWEEETELTDVEDQDEDFGHLGCGRHASDVVLVRAPRNLQKAT